METFVFDLDGTLAESKGPIDAQMRDLLYKLLARRRVCVVSGGQWKQFQDQLINQLGMSSTDRRVNNLFCFPTSGASCYQVDGNEWVQVYQDNLLAAEKIKIKIALIEAVQALPTRPTQIWGDTIEDRGAQITFSALGQLAPYEEKKKWDPTKKLRREMVKIIREKLEDKFEVRIGGTTSIDITRKGIHKGYAIQEICKKFNLEKKQLIFFGDALEPGGNDHEVYQTGVLCVPVQDHIDCIWKVRMMDV